LLTLSFRIMLKNKLTICPCDKDHAVKESRLQFHIVNCRLIIVWLFFNPFRAMITYM
ncbi:hypothetical protein TNCT_164901, partial [Trichonephila clavata]